MLNFIFKKINYILVLILTIIIIFLTNSNLNVSANRFINEEAYLTVGFKNKISFDLITSLIRENFKDQGSIIIKKISSEILIGNKKQTFTIENNNENTTKFLSKYVRKYNALFPTLLNLKEENNNEKKYQDFLNKYTYLDLKQAINSNGKINVKSMTISSFKKDVAKFKNIFSKFNPDLIENKISDLEKLVKNLELKFK